MKKLVCLILTAAFLAVLPCFVKAEAEAALCFDENAPHVAEGGEIVVKDDVFAGELLSSLVDRTGAAVLDPDGAPLAATDTAPSGSTLVKDGASATIAYLGDVSADGAFNVRDVIDAMLAVVGGTGVSLAADVDGDGLVNGRDVIMMMKKLVGWDVSFVLPAESAENEDEALVMYFDSPLHRIFREDTTVYGDFEGVFRSSKNELEDIQIILTSTEAKEGLTLDVGELTDAGGKTISHELRYGYYYASEMLNQLRGGDPHNTTSGWMADPYPRLNGDFAIGANESRTFLLKADVPADAESGWYRAPVVVRDAEGREVKRSTVRLYVWDFALDEETALNTLFCTSLDGIIRYNATQYVTDPVEHTYDEWKELYINEWFNFNLKNRLSDYHLPYDVTDPRADEFMDDPRVTEFVTAGGVQDKDYKWDDPVRADHLRAIYEKLGTNPVWAEKAYIYTVDEPGGDVERVKWQWDGAKSVLGDTPFKTIIPGTSTMIEDMLDYCNTFCPNIDVFLRTASAAERNADPYHYPSYGRYMNQREYQKYGNFQERYDTLLRERGDSMWCYICVSPQFPYANFFNSYQGAWQRMVLWQTYFIHSDGLLYWDTVFWNVAERDNRLINLKRTGSGDGLLLYPGIWWGEDMVPVPSIRYEYVRDGIEDFQYLKQLERVLGRDASMEYVGRLCEGILTFSEDYHDMTAARDELGWKLEELNALH